MNKHTLLASLIAAGLGTSCAAANTAYQDPNAPADMSMPPPGSDLAGVIGGCMVSSTYTATQTPAAMMVLLDRSSSMSNTVSMGNSKFTIAVQSILSAIDENVFDSMSLGLFMSPSGQVMGPQCLLGGLVPVSCANPPVPQIALSLAGTMKSSDASGVRSRIYSTLASTVPDSGYGDATPLYGAINSTLQNLQAYATTKRILIVLTDGTIDCTSLAVPTRPAYLDGNGCLDWENPQNIVTMLATANQDPNKPVDTFIVGMPGADTYDSTGKTYPQYHMRLALSAMAYAGSPNNVPANCTGKTYTQAGGDPTVPCHFDMTVQGGFTPTILANTIAQIRGKVAGCSYDLPMPAGVTIDKTQVNVTLTTDGNMPQNLFRRSDPNNQCTQTGCWDYSPDGSKVMLIGAACAAAQSAGTVNVKVAVGCQTIVG